MKCILIFLIVFVFDVAFINSIYAENIMENSLPTVIVSKMNKSELQAFASWFHQDWELIFPNFYIGADMYINSLPNNRKNELKTELKEFLDKYRNSDPKDLINAWIELGAQAWQADLNIHETLNDFINSL